MVTNIIFFPKGIRFYLQLTLFMTYTRRTSSTIKPIT